MKKVLKIVVDVLAWIILIAAFLVTVMIFSTTKNNGIASLFGVMPMSVQSDSMAPTFKTGDMILVKKIADVYTLSEGDVITFYTIIENKRVLNTHRITKVIEDGSRSYITKGDNNAVEDEVAVRPGEIVGKWSGMKVNGGGKVLDFLRSKTGFFICVVIPMAIFFLFELYKFIVALIESKQKMSKDEEDEIKRKAIEEYLAKQAGNAQPNTPADAGTAMDNTAETRASEADAENASE